MNQVSTEAAREMLRASTRRHFFRQSGFGIGAAALTGLLNNSLFAGETVRNRCGPEASYVSGQGEERYLPVHGRRSLASGSAGC